MKRKEQGSALPWVLAALGLGVLGGVAYAAFSGKSASPAERGYEVLSGCTGIKVLDDAKAMAYAEAAGASSSDVGVNPAAWITEVASILGINSLCKIDSYPVSSLGFLVRLLRAYIVGSAKAGHLPQEMADQIVANMQQIALSKGVPAQEFA